MNGLFKMEATHRSTNGDLATRARVKPHMVWSRISRGGKVHYVEGAIIRWNFFGGTFEKPQISYVILCGPQRRTLFFAPDPPLGDVCARCDAKLGRLDNPLWMT